MSKPQASLNLLTNHNLWIFGNPFSVSQSQAPFHCCFTSSVLWRGSLQKFCQAVRCKPSRFIGEDTLVSQQARLQTIWTSTTKTSKILKTTLAQRQKFGETGMSAEAQAQPAQQERTRKKNINKICVCGLWFVIYELERMLFEIDSDVSRKVSDSFTLKKIGPCF